MDSTGSQNDHFRFFDLPRELRDMIYLLSCPKTQNVKAQGHACETTAMQRISLDPGINLAALLVSRGFKREYEEKFSSVSRLVYEFQIGPVKPPISFIVPGRLHTRARHIVLVLAMSKHESCAGMIVVTERSSYAQWYVLTCAADVAPWINEVLPCIVTRATQRIQLSLVFNGPDVEDATIAPSSSQTHLQDASAWFNKAGTVKLAIMQAADTVNAQLRVTSGPVYLRNWLYSLRRDRNLKIAQRDRLWRELQCSEQNGVLYEARPSSRSQYAWKGVELTVVSAGTFDHNRYDQIVGQDEQV